MQMNMHHSLLALHYHSKTLEAIKSYEALAHSFVGSVLVYLWFGASDRNTEWQCQSGMGEGTFGTSFIK